MKIRIITCQNAFLSGTPTQERKTTEIQNASKQISLFRYACQDEDDPINDYYDGYSYRTDVVIDIPEVKPHQRENFKAWFKSRLNLSGSEKDQLLSKFDFECIAFTLVKEFNMTPVYTNVGGLTLVETFSLNKKKSNSCKQEKNSNIQMKKN